jgi:hypothetical protein
MHLEAYFGSKAYGSEPNGAGLIPGNGSAPIYIIAAVAGILMLFFIFWIRNYNVIVPDDMNIDGSMKVRRKSPYRFRAHDGYSDIVCYRIGRDEDGEWRLALRSNDGSYLIPKGMIKADVFLKKYFP